MTHFLVLTLPRSRSTWLSKFLSYRDWSCGHDELQYMRQLEDVRSWLDQPNTGTVETAAAPFWRLALHLKPDLKLVVIRRDPTEAATSAVNSGLCSDFDETLKLFKYLDHKLAQIELRTKCKSFWYEDLVDESVCKDLFEYLLPYKHDHNRWAKFDKENIQINVPALIRYVSAYKVQIERLSAIAKQKSLALLTTHKVDSHSGLDLGFESFKDLVGINNYILQEHCAEVGENPDNYITKNLDLLQKYEDMGALQVTTARSNGRIFGYLITLIGESLESSGRLSGCHTAFYGSTDYPGIGLKLQRKALEGLRSRDVFEVIMRAGTRGSGEKSSVLYRRMGAEPFGTYYRLQLKEA